MVAQISLKFKRPICALIKTRVRVGIAHHRNPDWGGASGPRDEVHTPVESGPESHRWMRPGSVSFSL